MPHEKKVFHIGMNGESRACNLRCKCGGDGMDSKDFYTFSGYMKKDENAMTASMEDYLEMIYRLSNEIGFTRIHSLSQALNVQPPSATKMVQHLSQMGFVQYQKYGFIMLEEKGKELGAWLLKRHLIIEELLRMLGADENSVLEETEKVEHMFSRETVHCFEEFVEFMKKDPEIAKQYAEFRKEQARPAPFTPAIP